MVAVGYERIKGRRVKNQKADGFALSASRLMNAPLASIYVEFADAERLKKWLGESLRVRTATANKSIRLDGPGGEGIVVVNFYLKYELKTQVSLDHFKLPDAQCLTDGVRTGLRRSTRSRRKLRPEPMLVFFHTSSANADSFEAIAQDLSPGLATRHVVRADLLDRGRDLGSASLALKQEVAQAIEESMMEGDTMLLCTCSTIGAGADLAMHLRIPVLRVDRPMAKAAVAFGDRILVAACLASTVQATGDLIREARPAAKVETLLIEDAWADWVAGNQQAYWARIAKRIEQHIQRFDAVVLAQASMAGAASLLTHASVPVLSSPRLGVAEAIRRMAASA